jgi:hypothetical protein
LIPNNIDSAVIDNKETILAANSEPSGWGVLTKSGEVLIYF